MRRWLSVVESKALLWASAGVLSCLVVLVRGRPTTGADDGIFLSVSARLVHGDRLYTGVWDNKPPLFYYADAVAFWVAGWRGPFFIDALWLAVACVSMWLLLGAAKASRLGRASGTSAYVLLLTGVWYQAGYSELPPLALAPLLGWLWLARRDVAAGGGFGVALFFHPDYLLVDASLVVAPLIAWRSARQGLTARMSRLAVGVAASVAAMAAVLAARGEFHGFIETMKANVGYENRALREQGYSSGIGGHLRVFDETFFHAQHHPPTVALAVLGVLVAYLVALGMRRRRGDVGAPTGAGPWFFAVVGAAVVVTLALTSLWEHNLELLALPGAFLAWFATDTLVGGSKRRRLPRALVALVASLLVLLALGGVSLSGWGSPQSSSPLAVWWSTPGSVTAQALDAAAEEVSPSGTAVTYARLGANNDEGHAAFAHRRLALACPVFHQYPFSSHLGSVLDCIQERRPELIVVGPDFGGASHPTRAWTTFLSASRHLLTARYHPLVTKPYGDKATVVVWRLRIKSEPPHT